MKDFTDCPDFSFLSQFFDQELEKQEADKIRQHLETCPECRAKGERLERMEATVRGVLSKSLSRLPPPAPSQECLSPEIISGYIQRTLPAEDGARAEKHLQACDACLNEVIEAFQISSSLASAKREPVLATLKARVASLWASPPGEEKTVSFPRLVIQIAQKGLRLLEQHLVSPLLDVQEILVPLPAYRSAEGPAALNLRINTGQAEIRTTAVQEGEGVALKMTFRDTEQEALAGQRVFLRQQGRSVFSARTDSEGVLQVPRLEPGIYEVACPGINVAFQLEMRS